MQDPIIFNIQRFSLHDGGGIRTMIFFKGCPLRCPWCSNPEGISLEPQILLQPARCIKCSAPSVYECAKEPWECPTGAKSFAGRHYTIEELKKEALKDAVFYEEDGGITLSGGEALLFAEYLSRFLPEIKREGVHVAVETTGNVPRANIEQVMEYIDLFLFDLKIMDAAQMRAICGGDIELIRRNFEFLSRHKQVIPRLPLIPGFTDSEENLREIRDLILSCGLKEVHILPYHSFGSSKYEQLGLEYTLAALSAPSKEEINRTCRLFEEEGIRPVVGGY